MGMKKTYPVKQDLNLAQKERKHRNLGAAALTTAVLAALIALFCKFGVLDRLDEVRIAQESAVRAEQLLAQTRTLTVGYDAVLEEYTSFSTANGAVGADPMECLDLIESELMAASKVSAFAVSDDLVSVQISGVTLREVSAIYTGLMDNELVSAVQVYTAATTGDAAAQVTAAMTIRLAAPEGAGEEAVLQ